MPAPEVQGHPAFTLHRALKLEERDVILPATLWALKGHATNSEHRTNCNASTLWPGRQRHLKFLTPLPQPIIIQGQRREACQGRRGIVSVNYYAVLQIEQAAGLLEIKRAFRRLLKRFHPDRNRGNAAWAEQRTRELVEAYHVLADAHRRKFHDQQLRSQRTAFRPTIVAASPFRDGLAAKCRHILESLLNGNAASAVEVYEGLRGSRSTFDLYPFLSLKDHLDCKFLLGEEYERQGRLAEALALYEEVWREELEGPRLRYFFEEVQERIVTIYCQHLPRAASPEEIVGHYGHALKLGLPAKERAEIRKRLAETLLKLGDLEGAERELREALRLRPSLKGVQRLAARLGVALTPA